ncbi:MAG: restriction endonuclease subunit S [Elusimicrobia bacterium]|nr:restriction endonuclease subunit S [Elusimicrobiota bacterium]
MKETKFKKIETRPRQTTGGSVLRRKTAGGQVREIPEGWKTYKLGDLAEITSSKRIFLSEYVPNGIPFWRSKEVIEKFSKHDISTELFISKERYCEIKSRFGVPQKNDILLTSVGTLGIPYIVADSDNEFYFKDGNLTWFKDFKCEHILPQYLYFWTRSKQGKRQLLDSSIGSTQQAFTIAGLKQVYIELPPLAEQKAIAKILGDLDEKIAINNRMNKTLEAMGQALFKRWFIDFEFPNGKGKPYKSSGGKMMDSELGEIPSSWGICHVPDMFDFLEGPGIRNWQYVESGMPFINIRLIQGGDINTQGANAVSLDEGNGKYAHFQLQERDMVVSTSGTLGRTAIVRKEHLPLLLNTSVIRFRPKDGDSYSYMYGFLKSIYFLTELESSASGSVQANFGPMHLENMKIIKAIPEVLAKFETIQRPFYKKIAKVLSENTNLATIRDSFLPKLMSGKIRVG